MRYLIVLSLLLSGCATCNQHPTECMVAVGVVVAAGVIAASNKHAGDIPQPNQIREWHTK